jgi:hypothetical protein
MYSFSLGGKKHKITIFFSLKFLKSVEISSCLACFEPLPKTAKCLRAYYSTIEEFA